MVRRSVRRKPDIEIRVVLPADYELQPAEINNLVYLTCKYGAGWPMRGADLALVLAMRDVELRGEAAVRNTIRVTCEYLWDHILGEPARPSVSGLYRKIAPLVTQWYGRTTSEQRSHA